MASSGWQGQQDIQTGKYPKMALNLRIDGITHSGTNLRVWGAVRAVVTSGNIYYNGVYVSWPGGGYSQNMNPVSTGGYVDWGFDTTIGGVAQTTTGYTFTASLSAGSTASGSASWWITFNASSSSPATPSVSIASIQEFGATLNVSLSSYGQPSGEANRYIEGAVLGQSTYGGRYRYKTQKAVNSATFVVDNSGATNANNPLTIVPNTQYWYGAYATNTAMANNTVAGTFITRPASISSLTTNDLGHGNISISVSHGTEGSAANVSTEYSTDGETWLAAPEPFVVHISQATTISVRRRNSSGATPVATTSVVPFVSAKLYCSVDGAAADIKKLYAPIAALTSLTATPNGALILGSPDTAKLAAKATAAYTEKFNAGYQLNEVVVTYDSSAQEFSVNMKLDNGTTTEDNWVVSGEGLGAANATLADWGIQVQEASVASSTIAIDGSYGHVSKEIKKLYGSADGESKLIYEVL